LNFMNYLVQHYIDSTFQKYPSNIAIKCGDGDKVSFEYLHNISNKLANLLSEIGVNRQDRIIICMKRSVNPIIAINGILKADSIYVPIDHKSPIERWRKIIADCSPKIIICDDTTIDKMIDAVSVFSNKQKIIVMGKSSNRYDNEQIDVFSQQQIEEQNAAQHSYKNIDTDIAYILYTSGSTGNPKGVMISHLNIINYIEWAIECFSIDAKDSILSTAPFHFDMSTFDIHCSMRTGATLCVAPDEYMLFPIKIFGFIKEENITIWKAVSSLLMYSARAGLLKKYTLPSLHKILFGGENLPVKYIIEWMTAYPEKQFYNVYGPTEATGISTYYYFDKIPKNNSEKVPIGKACGNSEVFIVNEDLTLAKDGDVGELCIRGSGVSRGYWNDLEKTNAAFIQGEINNISLERYYKTGDLAYKGENGNIYFIGRKDNQIKYMGYRIDISEIEAALLSIGEVQDTAVILTDYDTEGMIELVAFIETHKLNIESEVVAQLSNKVPPYMIPKKYITSVKIPRNNRGKVDRQKLSIIYSELKKNNA
jgi:D-alanine--poly(phosphoribitol) ligase subunit 1